MDEARTESKEGRIEKGGAFCASLLFHVLLLLVLASATSFDLRLGEQTRFDVIFWLAPSSVAPEGKPLLPVENAHGAARKAPEAVKAIAASAATIRKPAPPATAGAPRQAAPGLRVETPAHRQGSGEVKAEAPADATLLLASAAGPLPAPAAVKEEKAASPRERRVERAAKGTAAQPELEQNRPSELPMPVRLAAFLDGRLSPQKEVKGVDGASAAVAARKEPFEALPSSNRSPAPAVERSEDSPRGAARASAGGGVERDQPASVKNERPAAEKHPEPRGIMTSSLQGDLKMIISGDSGIRLIVTFREFPKSRRNRPLTRSEARREQRVQPLVAKTDQRSREAVVETARDGIYIFSAEPEQGERGEATFTLKLFERGGKERIAEIGAKSITRKAVIARVLMRDGILWDDDSAFTGCMDDSESTTKFNVETGLYWKEYHH